MGGTRLGERRGLLVAEVGRVAVTFQLVNELGTSGGDDTTLHQDVDDVGPQLGEQALVVGDGQHAQAVLVGLGFDASAHVDERIHIEARVDLVEDGKAWPEHTQLQRLVALLLTTGEIDVQGPRKEALVESDALRLGHHQRVHVAARPPRGDEGLVQHRLQRHTGHFRGVLHRQEKAGPGPLPGGQAQQVEPVEGDRSAEDLITGLAHEHMRQRRLARAVRAHDGVHLAASHNEVDAAQDLLAVDARAEALDDQLTGRVHGNTTQTEPSSTWTS